MSKWIHFFNILTLLFCMLQGITRFYSSFMANIFITLEIICFVVVIVLFVVGLIRIKKQEKKFKEDLRNMALEFLKTKDTPNTLEILGESDDIKE